MHPDGVVTVLLIQKNLGCGDVVKYWTWMFWEIVGKCGWCEQALKIVTLCLQLLLLQCRCSLKTFIIRLDGKLKMEVHSHGNPAYLLEINNGSNSLFGLCLEGVGQDFLRDTILVFRYDLSANAVFWSKSFVLHFPVYLIV